MLSGNQETFQKMLHIQRFERYIKTTPLRIYKNSSAELSELMRKYLQSINEKGYLL